MLLYLPQQLVSEVLTHALEALPDECVGLLLGKRNCATRRVPLPNVARDPTRHFEADPDALLRALMQAEERGEDLVAIYHSHPHGPSTPSNTDLEQARYHAYQLIVHPGPNNLRAFHIMGNQVQEVGIIVGTEPFLAATADWG